MFTPRVMGGGGVGLGTGPYSLDSILLTDLFWDMFPK